MRSANLKESIALKQAELSLLANLCNSNDAVPVKIKDYDSFIKLKSHLMRRLRAHAYLANTYPNSNYENHHTEWYGFKLQHKYSRQGDPLIGKGQLKALYPIAISPIPSQGYFFSSGQAANLTIISVLNTHYGLTPQFVGARGYFETLEILNALAKTRGKKKYLYFDSASADFDWQKIFESLDHHVLVLDTTCIDRYDQNLGHLFKKISKLKSPVILVRSHLKLDSFGVEYGALGSAIVLNPDAFPSLLRTKNEPNPLKTIQGAIKSVGGVLGNFPSIDSIYPFLTSPEIGARNVARLARIRANNLSLSKFLTKQGKDVELRPHGYFLELRRVGMGKSRVAMAASKLRLVTDFPVYYSDSFGFDFSAVTTYRDYHSKKDYECLRIAAPDLVPGEFEENYWLYDRLVANFLR